VKVRQHADLILTSKVVEPSVISERIGLVPDEVRLMGSRHSDPPAMRPAAHIWELRSGLPDGVPLSDHFTSLLAKVDGSAERLRALLADGRVAGCIQVARHFEPGPEDPEIIEPGRQVGDLVRLGGQHPLVGFEIEPALVAFAAAAGLGFDFDEYGDEDE
jgi:Domain of unknown function (DUF4279)